ncbi:MAG: glycosyltransferase family 4 protein [Actinomycetota bacterium]
MKNHGPRRLSVLVVGQGPPAAGGIPSFVTSLVADEWLRSKVDIDYLNTTPRWTKRPGKFDISNLRQLLSDTVTLMARSRNSDIVHLNLAPTPLPPLCRAILLALIVKVSGAKVMLHAHSGRLAGCMRNPIYGMLMRILLRIAHVMVVVSAEASRATSHLSGVVRLDNGIAAERAPTGPKDEDPPLLSFVGTVCERKGLMDLLRALETVRDDNNGLLMCRVVIIGDARQEGPQVFERMQEAFSAAGLGGVEFLGRLERPEVADLLARSSIFCLPSHWEAFPISLLEAMAAETGIVATAVGDIPRILDDGAAGRLVPVQDPNELAKAISDLIEQPEQRADLARAARRRVLESFSLTRNIREIFEIYSALAVVETESVSDSAHSM